MKEALEWLNATTGTCFINPDNGGGHLFDHDSIFDTGPIFDNELVFDPSLVAAMPTNNVLAFNCLTNCPNHIDNYMTSAAFDEKLNPIVAQSDERWSQLQSGLDHLCVRLESIIITQQLVAAQIGQTSKVLEQLLASDPRLETTTRDSCSFSVAAYGQAMTARHGEDYDWRNAPIDPEAGYASGGGKTHGRYPIFDRVVDSTQIQSCQRAGSSRSARRGAEESSQVVRLQEKLRQQQVWFQAQFAAHNAILQQLAAQQNLGVQVPPMPHPPPFLQAGWPSHVPQLFSDSIS